MGDTKPEEERPIVAADSRVDSLLRRTVFVVGAPRSGTTWLQRMLLSHPNCCGGQETQFFNTFGVPLRSFYELREGPRNVGLARYWEEGALLEAIYDLYRRTVAGVVRAEPKATLLVDKTPAHARFIREIIRICPEARFIHLIRDPRAVVSSLLRAGRSWGKIWASKRARNAALTWFHHARDAHAAGSELPEDRFLEVWYEDLRAKPLVVFGGMLEFLGIPADPDTVERIVRENDAKEYLRQVEKPVEIQKGVSFSEPAGFVRSANVDSWRSELTLLEKVVVWRYSRRMMAELGRPISPRHGWRDSAGEG